MATYVYLANNYFLHRICLLLPAASSSIDIPTEMGHFFHAVCYFALAAVYISTRLEYDSRSLVEPISKQTLHNVAVFTKNK